ncbi:o-succinylbenzoate synthase [Haloferula helveola]|uniref:O-succinylbenzoate synthase n=1 Tax=Haloferula helveola TaxID=490095 RepID=A0ABM7R802_9BACT|nr:o-succinylbenzoate synthase [Haloferula helveola]
MAEEIWYWNYELTARQPLNSKSTRRTHRGVLLRIDDGFACIQPWPELGDPDLAKCLADLNGARRWPIVRRAIRCAKEDADARFIGDPLLEEIDIPESHATLPWHDERIADSAVEKGFTRIKMKAGRDLSAESAYLRETMERHPSTRWRIDFNESPTAEEAVDFVAGLPAELRQRLDFLEDPCPYSEEGWKALRRETGVPLAVDREAAPLCSAAQVMVIKPAVDEPWLLAEAAAGRGQQVVVTSYMEHPLGQCFAAWEAAKLNVQFPGLVGICGLQTHQLFTPCPFSERLGRWSPAFKPPGGTGLGFDDLLERLPWKRLD